MAYICDNDFLAFLLLSLCSLATLIQFVVYRFFLKVLNLSENTNGQADILNKPLPSVSVIICAKNEEQNLSACLESLLKQEYPDYELIVVNDNSTDNTLEILNKFNKKYSHLRVKTLESKDNNYIGKRYALLNGVEMARNDFLLFSDADCKAVSNLWISKMMLSRKDNTKIVLGHGPYYSNGSLLDSLFLFENTYTAIKYFSALSNANPYMCVGRNYAVERDFFIHNLNSLKNAPSLSGDDDLFVNRLSSADNTVACLDSSAYMYSESPASLIDYIKQKRRHMSAGVHYKSRDKFWLGFEFLLPISLYVAYFIGLFCTSFWPWFLTLFILKVLLQSLVFRKLFTLFDNRTPMVHIPILDLTYFILTLVIIISIKINSNVKWQ